MKYIIIDTETTGLDPDKHEMIAFGAIVMIDHIITETIEIKWHPIRPDNASEEALAINGYSNYNWRDAISVQEAAQIIRRFMHNHLDGICVGHNLYFDRKFISSFANEHDIVIKLASPYLDTRDLCRSVLMPYGLQSMRLDDICEFLGWKRRRAHSALSDCEDCAKLMQALAPPTFKFIMRLKIQQNIRRIRSLL